jgi:hypothetical protein
LKLVAVAGGGQTLGPICTSTNSGAIWASNSVPTEHWKSVACSADGTRLIAVAAVDYYTSTNSGGTWISNSIPSVTWNAVASSADGAKLVAAVITGGTHRILTSTNSGTTWATNDAPVSRLAAVASSADGFKLVAVEQNRIWFTTNAGAAWMSNNVTGFWHGVASSADGGKWVVVDGSPGGIWISQTTPRPNLNLALSGSFLTASWIVPSTNLVLQQNLALATTNWMEVTNPPTLNLSNMQSEVSILPSGGSGFFRLATPGL